MPHLPCPGAVCPAARGCCQRPSQGTAAAWGLGNLLQAPWSTSVVCQYILIFQITFEHFWMLYSCMCVQILGNLKVNKITGHCKSKCFAHMLRCSWCVEGWRAVLPLGGTLSKQFCVIVFVIFFIIFYSITKADYCMQVFIVHVNLILFGILNCQFWWPLYNL